MTATVSIRGPMVSGRLLSRKRFILSVRSSDKIVEAFLPNTGRLSKILAPGGRLLMRPVPLRKRAPFDVLVGFDDRVPVVLDSRIPNMLILDALKKRELPEFRNYSTVSSEVKIGKSRLDFKLKNGRPCYVEVKGVTLKVGNTALYPDAPTERGRRHLDLLISLVRSGDNAAVVFVSMRPDVRAFQANSAVDPLFARLLHKCEKNGVIVLGYGSEYKRGSVRLTHKLVCNLERV